MVKFNNNNKVEFDVLNGLHYCGNDPVEPALRMFLSSDVDDNDAFKPEDDAFTVFNTACPLDPSCHPMVNMSLEPWKNNDGTFNTDYSWLFGSSLSTPIPPSNINTFIGPCMHEILRDDKNLVPTIAFKLSASPDSTDHNAIIYITHVNGFPITDCEITESTLSTETVGLIKNIINRSGNYNVDITDTTNIKVPTDEKGITIGPNDIDSKYKAFTILSTDSDPSLECGFFNDSLTIYMDNNYVIPGLYCLIANEPPQGEDVLW